MNTIQTIIFNIIKFINGYVVPLVFALAFALFLFGVFRFFFVKGADAKSRTEGRNYMISAIVAFAVMVSVWGLVNILTGSINLGSNSMPKIPSFNTGDTGTTNTGTGVDTFGTGTGVDTFSGGTGVDSFGGGPGNDQLK